jgi:coenzyme F420-reducing hydrogenase delta subunit
MKIQEKSSKIILFTCNWNAYSGLEAAGAEKRSYSTSVHPIRISCLGRITPGIILKAFEKGAKGVYLLGCLEGECHYETGSQQIKQVFLETRNLLKLLGYQDNQFQMDFVAAGNGKSFVENIQRFVKGIEENQENQ